jgi:very-short-patch-repair endonuclease
VQIGGRLTGVSALDAMGAWVLDRSPTLHVAVEPRAGRLRRDGGPVRIHWVAASGRPCSAAIVGLPDALVQTILTEPLETAVSCVDWALSTGRLDRIAWERLLLRLPKSARVIRGWVDPNSQSVLESVARVRLRARGWSVRSQVRVGDIQAIDLVVEEHVALELDGREHHEARFEEDRAKDLQITIEGRHSIRVTHRILRSSWPRVEAAILAALAARRAGDAGHSGVRPRTPRGSRQASRPKGSNS